MKKTAPAIIYAVLLISAANAETLEISGGTTPEKHVIEPQLAAIKQATGVDIKFNAIGTGNGMVELIEGKVPVAAVGDVLHEAITAAKKAAEAQGKHLAVPGNLFYTHIGRDEQVVIVHKSNPVAALSKTQLKNIATGAITNWKEVGGRDLPVTVIVTQPGLAPGLFFQKVFMDGEAYAEDTTEAQTPSDVISRVSGDIGGIGAAAAVHMADDPGEAKVIKAPPAVRTLGLVTVGEPSGAAKKVIDFLKRK